MTPTKVKDTSYGNASIFDKIGLGASLVFHLPFVVGWTLLTKPFHRTNAHKSWKRALSDRIFYHLTRRLNVKQLQWALGNTLDVYTDYMKGKKLPLVIDELGENARLLWLGGRRTDRVILYLHGGGYLIPMQFFVPDFYQYVLDDLQSKDKETSVAILQFSLVPTARFPTQLKQIVIALQHLFSLGVSPRDIQISGDSAGANLALQLFSHILHPVHDVPRLTLTTPFRGVLFMSPWVSLTSNTGSMITNGDSDVIGVECLTYWGQLVLDGVPEKDQSYTEAYYVPNGWFEGLSGVVENVLITAGDAECMRDVIVAFADRIKGVHPGARFVLQEHGVHNDPYFDFFTKEKKKGVLTSVILDFFASNFDSSN